MADGVKDELIELHAAYGNAQKEISDLKSHNDILINRVEKLEKSNYKMRGKNQKQGAQLLKCKNELRNPNPDWKQFNKANRQ